MLVLICKRLSGSLKRGSVQIGPRGAQGNAEPRNIMIETIAILLVLLWLLGLVTATTFGGYIHLLIVVAFGALLLRLIRGRNPLG